MVDHDETGIRLRFGRVVEDALEPGLRWGLPAPIERLEMVSTGLLRRVEVGEPEAPVPLLTGDENLLDLTLVAQYRVVRPASFRFSVESVDALVQRVVRAAALESAAGLAVEEVLTRGKAQVQNRVRAVSQEALERANAGVAITSVTIQSSDPPREASEAFREVVGARAQASERVSRAQAERSRSLAIARGEAEQRLAEARSASDRRRFEAQGAAQRFTDLVAAWARDPRQKELAKTDFYLRTIREVLPRARVVVLAPGEKPRLHLQWYQNGTPPVAADTVGEND